MSTFTIRIERSTGDREVYGCARYEVRRGEVTLYSTDETSTAIGLGPGDRAFAMNEAGATVDAMRGAGQAPQAVSV